VSDPCTTSSYQVQSKETGWLGLEYSIEISLNDKEYTNIFEYFK